MRKLSFLLAIIIIVASCGKNNEPVVPDVTSLSVVSVQINGSSLTNNGNFHGVAGGVQVAKIVFNNTVDPSSIVTSGLSFGGTIGSNYKATQGDNKQTIVLTSTASVAPLTSFTFSINTGVNLGGKIVTGFSSQYMTAIDSTAKFPTLSDNDLLTLIQQKTLSYFTDYAHPVSGMARERLGSGETVTTGGSGFGLMAMLVGIERGFLTRSDGFSRINKVVNFLNTQADKFHGAFPHWMNGTTGKVIPFSTKDDGGDLVETAFMMQGLLSVREYFKNGNSSEQAMCDTIQKLWQNVEWDWYRQNGQNVLYWHWSPDYGWAMNMPIAGYNEALIVYILAAASPTHSIPKEVYTNGWAKNGGITNGKTFEGTILPLGSDYGGPLFFTHYSFLGLDPRNLRDQYASYWQQNTAHAKINNMYCIRNPGGYYGYSADSWGLTASDIPNGYSASSPINDLGVIAPTAALSSMPYTPNESLRAARFFYYMLGDKLWSNYGFYDAFSLNTPWFSNSYLAIDEGPIVVMIENYRTQLLWHLFMQNSDIQQGLTKLGFTY
ncbi:glucoamylase family protein [Paludibacter jiangxiensis]|uniref:Glycoamylase-like domain-containing protein n=1 Tax=Paludibacter jiangxiensis TaxID=681398 RepID=A0A171AJI0_9BACT|nr:glucoamylase family protein [Paludibacter jiangxiensis]GAT63839.1 hypothetical protein PJIAN_4381 [Paludibacter jiangxiensis]